MPAGRRARAPVICPRSAILHSAAASMVDGILDVTVSTAERIATLGIRSRRACARSMAFCDDVGLVLQRGGDVDRRIGDEQRLRIGRHVHDEHVADAPCGADAGVFVNHLAHQLIGVETALHQRIGFTGTNELHGLRRRGVAVRSVDELQRGNVEAERSGERADAALRPDENGPYDFCLCRLHRTPERGLVARVRDGRP